MATRRVGDAATRRCARLAAAVACACAAAPIAAQTHEHQHEHAADHAKNSSAGSSGSASAKQTLGPEALAQIRAVRDATARYRDIEAARADGYVRFGRTEGPLMGEHWYRKDDVKRPLDLMHPSTLQYAVIDGKRELLGVAYTVYQHPGEPIPAGFAGEADHWHVHDVAKLARSLVADRPFLSWLVNRRIENGKIGGGDGRTMLVMLHAWVWSDNPDGVFALQHRALPYLRAGLPASFAEGASEDAAWGVALGAATGCDAEVARTNALAKLAPAQKTKLLAICEEQAARVRAVLREVLIAAMPMAPSVNATAESAWRAYSQARSGILDAGQTAALASVMEHDPMAMGQSH